MELEEIKEYIKNKLSEKRYYHSKCVMERSEELAKQLGADIEIAQKIGIAHDVAKEISEEEKLKYVKENNIEIDDTERKNTSLLHAKIGKDIAIKKFGFTEYLNQLVDKNIDEAVLYILDKKIELQIKKRASIHVNGIIARNYILEQINN